MPDKITPSSVMPDALLSKLNILAALSPDKEICGLITSDYHILPIKNVARQGNQFVMDKLEYLRALSALRSDCKDVFAVYHSHPNGDLTPSECDIKAARTTGHNYLIVTSHHYKWVNV